MKWIELGKGRPQEGKKVLIWFPDLQHPRIASYHCTDGGGNYWSCDFGTVSFKTVTHWMPLPEIPQ